MNTDQFKKRVVHLTFDMSIGGAEKVICNLIENMDPSKVDASILCIDQPVGPFGTQLRKKGFKIISFNRKPGFDLNLVLRIRKFITLNKVDVLHCHQYTPYVYGVISAAFTPCKIIFTEHGRFYPDQRKLKRVLINPFLCRFTDRIIAIAGDTKRALIEFENFPGHKIKVVYNGINDTGHLPFKNSDLKNHLKIGDDTIVLGTVARLDLIKNQAMMIRALKIVRQEHPDTIVIIVGDGPERKNLENLSSTLQLTPNVFFTGFSEDAISYYHIMDIFLLTSFSEGTAMTLLEAMAASLPCIATNVGGNPEIVENNETGYLIPSNDETSLAERICALIDNQKRRQKMGEAGRKRFIEHFTVAKMVKSYQAIYDEAD